MGRGNPPSNASPGGWRAGLGCAAGVTSVMLQVEEGPSLKELSPLCRCHRAGAGQERLCLGNAQ